MFCLYSSKMMGKTYNWKLNFLAIGLVFIGYLIFIKPVEDSPDSIKRKSRVFRVNTDINARVVSKHNAQGIHVTFSNDSTYFFNHTYNRNYPFPDDEISRSLEIGDSIIKSKDSDTIVVIKKDLSTRWFIVNQIIPDLKVMK